MASDIISKKQLTDYGALQQDLNANTVCIASEKYAAFKKNPSSRDSEFVVVNLVTKEVNRIPAVGSAFALSANGNYVALIDNHRLELVRVATGEIERSTTLDSDTTVARMKWLNDHISGTDEITAKRLQDGLKWAKARKQHWNHQGGMFTIWRLYQFGPLTTLFETVAPYLPNRIFQWVIRIRKRTSM